MFIEDLLDRSEYTTRWRSDTKSEVYAHRLVRSTLRPGTVRKDVGCVFIGSAEECRKYIGRQVGGLQLSCGKLYHTKGASNNA
jgi:hypothetical protein